MQEVDIIISGGRTLTMDEKDTIFHNGCIAIDGNTVVGVGGSEEMAARFSGRRVIDARDCLVMPGLVNGHTHAAMTCFRGLADDMELMDWLNNYIFPAEARNVDPELVYWGSALACAEMIQSGTTTFCDMYLFEDETAQVARQAGMRCLLGEGIFDFSSPNAQTPEDGLAYSRMLIEKWADDPLVNIMIEPHSLYTCSPDIIKKAKALADEYSLPFALHLLETRGEVQQLEERFGMKATRFLKELGCLDERFFAFHCVCMDEEDMKLFADHGCKVVHNPESNMKLASGIAPVATMLEHGIVVGLGTDGCASNNNLDMFDEMGTAARLGKVERLDPTVLPAKTVTRMATRDGARVLGMGDITGSLKTGMRADIIMIDLNKPHLTPIYDEYSHIVYAAGGSDVKTVIIDGRIVMEDRRLLTIDENEAMARVREIAERVKRSLET